MTYELTESSEPTHCALCHRLVSELTKHHLIPRTRHKNKKNKKDFDREEVKSRLAWLCRPCHKNVHALFSEKTLEREFPTLESLAAHPEIQKFTEWIANKPDGFRVQTSDSKSKR